jgi:salicylate hydroxylase
MGIKIKFGKRLRAIETDSVDQRRMQLQFEDGTRSLETYDVVYGADGVKSRVRENMFGAVDVAYTGITCLMGASPIPRPFRGICFPSSSTTRCHACFYPTGENEQVFQIYFPTEERPETWGNLTPEEARKECIQLADRLLADGWHRDFVDPIKNSHSVIRVGLRSREPLKKWVLGRRVLLGDAAHPPVPYIGQVRNVILCYAV